MSHSRLLDYRENGVDYSDYQQFFDFVPKPNISVTKDRVSRNHKNHSFRVAPLFTTKVHAFAVERIDGNVIDSSSTYPQYGLLGSVVTESEDLPTLENLVFSNTSEPWSAFICGSQGSGKSYTLSCLMENALLKSSAVNVTKTPSTGIVFHYDKFSNLSTGQLCEAAYLSSTGIPVTVLVCPTSLEPMKKRYKDLLSQSNGSPNVQIKPFYLKDEQLSTEIMMTIMAVDGVGERTPLYITSIRQLLRQMILDRPNEPVFDYKEFLHRLDQLPLTKDQLGPLSLRLDLLKSVLVDTMETPELRKVYDEIWQPKSGSLTIVDLSDPFVTESDACALFSISLKLFIGGWRSAPRIIALDEAHKFLKSSIEAQKLTSDLVSVVRQQRHLGSRVIVATQEPTVSEELLALCNVSIVHRFTSPQWYGTLRQHLIAAHRNSDDQSLLHEIAGLDTGHAMVFCPTAILDVSYETGKPILLRDTYFKLAVRGRVSADGGESILPTDHSIPSMYDRKCTSPNSLLESTTNKLSSCSITGSTVASKGFSCVSTILDDTGTSPIAMRYQKRCWTESELEQIIYRQIRLLLGSNPAKYPWPLVISSTFTALEEHCGVPERFFADNELNQNCTDKWVIDMMKRLLKNYYDELQIQMDQRARKWLRD